MQCPSSPNFTMDDFASNFIVETESEEEIETESEKERESDGQGYETDKEVRVTNDMFQEEERTTHFANQEQSDKVQNIKGIPRDVSKAPDPENCTLDASGNLLDLEHIQWQHDSDDNEVHLAFDEEQNVDEYMEAVPKKDEPMDKDEVFGLINLDANNDIEANLRHSNWNKKKPQIVIKIDPPEPKKSKKKAESLVGKAGKVTQKLFLLNVGPQYVLQTLSRDFYSYLPKQYIQSDLDDMHCLVLWSVETACADMQASLDKFELLDIWTLCNNPWIILPYQQSDLLPFRPDSEAKSDNCAEQFKKLRPIFNGDDPRFSSALVILLDKWDTYEGHSLQSLFSQKPFFLKCTKVSPLDGRSLIELLQSIGNLFTLCTIHMAVGYKFVTILTPENENDQTASALLEFFHGLELNCVNTVGYKVTTVLLDSGESIVMPPMTVHYVVTTDTAVCHSGHFYCMLTIWHTCWALLHMVHHENFTNMDYDCHRVMLARIVQYWHYTIIKNTNFYLELANENNMLADLLMLYMFSGVIDLLLLLNIMEFGHVLW
ncbi:hypothetical protein Moror_13514 [Moniliophthora roreri MCA 2997]|uniref:JmjC domain-containing protein n=1 Tax=Moniliophthora roreri (strain MCA 2997) TaxID=1381753 RepID=V2WTE8_MONRO|nr:hypothetical protein Moror_13514 [Moniliophthora roreri MCA 2997]